jgi:pseudouridine synthase
VLKRLSEGIVIDGRRTLPTRITVLGGEQHTWVAVVLQEGRRNQIRRMFTKAGHPVLKLRRVAIGPISDRGLPPGAWRRLTPDELRRLDGALR